MLATAVLQLALEILRSCCVMSHLRVGGYVKFVLFRYDCNVAVIDDSRGRGEGIPHSQHPVISRPLLSLLFHLSSFSSCHVLCALVPWSRPLAKVSRWVTHAHLHCVWRCCRNTGFCCISTVTRLITDVQSVTPSGLLSHAASTQPGAGPLY